MTKKFSYSLDKNASIAHKAVVTFFKEKLPTWNISQNHKVEIDNKKLFADIYCNSPFKFIIEIHGEQHYKYTPHFHGSQDGFKTAKLNDSIKKNWAEMNSFIFIEVRAKDFKVENFQAFLMAQISEGLD